MISETKHKYETCLYILDFTISLFPKSHGKLYLRYQHINIHRRYVDPNACTLYVSTLIITIIQLLYIHKTIGCLDIMLLFLLARIGISCKYALIESLSACRVCVCVIEDVSLRTMVDCKCLWRGYQLPPPPLQVPPGTYVAEALTYTESLQVHKW